MRFKHYFSVAQFLKIVIKKFVLYKKTQFLQRILYMQDMLFFKNIIHQHQHVVVKKKLTTYCLSCSNNSLHVYILKYFFNLNFCV